MEPPNMAVVGREVARLIVAGIIGAVCWSVLGLAFQIAIHMVDTGHWFLAIFFTLAATRVLVEFMNLIRNYHTSTNTQPPSEGSK